MIVEVLVLGQGGGCIPDGEGTRVEAPELGS